MGSHLAEKMCSVGSEVVGLDDLSSGYVKNLSSLRNNKRFKFIKGDILKIDDLSKASKNVNIIFHLAAQSSVPKSTKDPLRDFEVNVQGTFNVLECARKGGIEAVIFASSSTVYGESTLPTPEEHPLLPISNYGASKAAAEVYCSSYSSLYGLKTASLRYFNIYGPRSRKGVMFDLLQKLQKNGKKLEVLGTGAQTKDYLYISDAVEATILVATKGKLTGGAYNIGSGENYSVKEIVKKLLRILGLDRKTKPFYTGFSWRGDVQKTLADISRLRKLGHRQKVGFDHGLSAFVDWYRAEYGVIDTGRAKTSKVSG
jgi:UDP-glucose 4-epimerase